MDLQGRALCVVLVVTTAVAVRATNRKADSFPRKTVRFSDRRPCRNGHERDGGKMASTVEPRKINMSASAAAYSQFRVRGGILVAAGSSQYIKYNVKPLHYSRTLATISPTETDCLGECARFRVTHTAKRYYYTRTNYEEKKT